MIRTTALALGVLVLSCGGADSDGADSDGADSGDCSSVCFEIDPPQEVVRAPSGAYLPQDCNEAAADWNHCPAGYHCGRTVDGSLAGPVCEPDAAGILDFEIPRLYVADVDAPSRVAIRFTMNGEAWPVAAAEQSAGTLALRRRGEPAQYVFELPTGGSDVLDISIAPGDYDVRIIPGPTVDSSQFPQVGRSGTLTVRGDGDVTIDLERAVLSFTLSVDGQVPTLIPGEQVQVAIFGKPGVAYRWIQTGDLRGQLAVIPGTYEMSLSIVGNGGLIDGDLSLGEVELETDVEREIALATVEVGGSVTNRTGEIEGGTRVQFLRKGEVLQRTGGSRSFAVEPGSPGSFAGRLYAGSYEVSLRSGDGAVLVDDDYAAGGPLDIEYFELTVSGALYENGAPLSDLGYVASVVFENPQVSGFTFVRVAESGPATFSARLPMATYEVRATGVGITGSAFWKGPEYEPSAETLVLDITTHEVSFDVTYRGEPLPTGPDGVAKGAIRLGGIAIPLDAQPRARVPEGEWLLSYENSRGSGYTGLPEGRYDVGTVEVDGDTTLPLDIDTVAVSIEVSLGSRDPTDADAGKDRGVLLVGGSLSQTFELPVEGPATLDAEFYPGLYRLNHICRAPDCDTGAWSPASEPETVLLQSLIEFR